MNTLTNTGKRIYNKRLIRHKAFTDIVLSDEGNFLALWKWVVDDTGTEDINYELVEIWPLYQRTEAIEAAVKLQETLK